MRIHLVGIFHTIHSSEYSHCAFTGKAMRFSKMLGEHYDIIEYANQGSESVSCTKEIMLTKQEVEQYYPRTETEFIGKHAVVGSPGWNAFNERLVTRLRTNVKAGDIVAHPFGQAHTGLVQAVPIAAHLETGIGYPDVPFGAWRIFESEAWRHYHWGKHEKDHWQDSGMNREFSWVIPNYYDLSDWDVSRYPSGFSPLLDHKSSWRNEKPYVIYMGRIDPNKGAVAAAVIARTWFEKYPRSNLGFLFAGQGDFGLVQKESKLSPEQIGYLGPVSGRIRSLIQGHAIANIMPTRFIEPFGGSGVEGQLCGTPLIASDSGAFTETVQPGVNGYRCKTLGDWIWALDHVESLDREQIARDARKRYSLQTCRDQYIKAIECVAELCSGTGKGWTSGRSYTLDNAGIVGSAFDSRPNPAVVVLPAEIQAKVTENLAKRVGELKEEKQKLVDVIREMKKAEMQPPVTEEDHKAAGAERKLPPPSQSRLADPFDIVRPELVSSGTNGAEGSSTPVETPAGANGGGPTFAREPGTNPATPHTMRVEGERGIGLNRPRVPRFNPDQLRAIAQNMRGGKLDVPTGLDRTRDLAIIEESRLRLDAAQAELKRHRDFEASYWGDCTNTHEEEEKHYVYARLMGLRIETVPNRAGYYCWDVGDKTILDIGGGPASMLLKAKNLKKGLIVDPTDYPSWVRLRYLERNVYLLKMEGESLGDDKTNAQYDEVWIYNVLQHVRDPALVIQNALSAAPVLRLLEWIDIPPHEGHPHMLTEQKLVTWLSNRYNSNKNEGSRTQYLNERGCVGRAFYGVF